MGDPEVNARHLSEHKVRNSKDQMWERACSRWRFYIRHQCWLSHRYREQARSHRGLASFYRMHFLGWPSLKPGSSIFVRVPTSTRAVVGRSHSTITNTRNLWRGGLPPLGREAALKSVIALHQEKYIRRFTTASPERGSAGGGKPPRQKCPPDQRFAL